MDFVSDLIIIAMAGCCLTKCYKVTPVAAVAKGQTDVYSGAGRGSDVTRKRSENPNNVSVNDPVTGGWTHDTITRRMSDSSGTYF